LYFIDIMWCCIICWSSIWFWCLAKNKWINKNFILSFANSSFLRNKSNCLSHICYSALIFLKLLFLLSILSDTIDLSTIVGVFVKVWVINQLTIYINNVIKVNYGNMYKLATETRSSSVLPKQVLELRNEFQSTRPVLYV
jgi:fatty-acid desaturase